MFPLKSTGIRDCNKTPCASFASKNDALKRSRTSDDMILLSLLSFTPISSVCCETQNKSTILMIKGPKHLLVPTAICEFAFTLLI